MIDVVVQQDAVWDETIGWENLASGAITQAVRETPFGNLASDPIAIEVSVKLTDNAEVQALNAAYRDKDQPTNVLSFPMVQKDLLSGLANSDDGEVLLGDIVLAGQTCINEAQAKNIALEDHATHLLVHGTLHLLGYDHELGEAEADAMEALECAALAALGIANPYQPDTDPGEVK
jgi:probable rRNA maturation factor